MNAEQTLSRVRQFDTEGDQKAELCKNNLLNLLTGKISNKYKAIIATIHCNDSGPVLDVGCGYGEMALYLALSGMRLVGIDINDKGIQSAQKLRDHLQLDNLEFQCMDALNIHVSGFKKAYCSDFYEHLSYEKHLVHLKNIHFALEQNGIYFIRAPHRDNIRQNLRDGHIGLPTYRLIHSEAASCGFLCSFMIGHTRMTSPLPYHFFLEQVVDKMSFSAENKYKMLKKCGLANVLVQLKKR